MNIPEIRGEKTDNIIKKGWRMIINIVTYVLTCIYASSIMACGIFVLASPLVVVLFMIEGELAIAFLRNIVIMVFVFFLLYGLLKGGCE